MNTTPTPMTNKAHLTSLLALGLPLIGSHIAQMAVQVVDTIMLGWYSVPALAGVVLGGTLFFTIFIVASGFSWAVMPMVASASESGDDTAIRRVTRMGIWVSLLAAVIAMPVMLFSGPILRLIGQDPALSAIAQEYLRIAGWGMFPALLVMVMKSYLSALEHARIVLIATVLAAILNVFLNYALIFGHWGAPELGVRGAAIASVVLQVATLVVLMGYARHVLPQHQLFRRFWRPDWPVLAQVTRMGGQIGLTSLAEAGLFSVSTVIMGWIGTLELAAHGIALQIVSLFFMLHVGLSNAATVRAGRAFGRKDQAGLRRGAMVAIAVSFLIGILSVAVFLLLPNQMMALFLDPDEALRDQIMSIGRGLMAVAALFQMADATQVMALGLLRGVQDTRAPMWYATFSYWVVGVPMSYLMGVTWNWGGTGVWMGLVVGLLLAAILMMTRFWRRSSRL